MRRRFVPSTDSTFRHPEESSSPVGQAPGLLDDRVAHLGGAVGNPVGIEFGLVGQARRVRTRRVASAIGQVCGVALTSGVFVTPAVSVRWRQSERSRWQQVRAIVTSQSGSPTSEFAVGDASDPRTALHVYVSVPDEAFARSDRQVGAVGRLGEQLRGRADLDQDALTPPGGEAPDSR